MPRRCAGWSLYGPARSSRSPSKSQGCGSPGMLHVGDITKLRGAELPPVDIVCGGSPCQDLSIAGLRAGLAGARSGLFMEQLRVIREMRDADRARGRTALAVRPRYMLWENVPGAFSSYDGEDFRAVLEETARVAEPDVSIPRPEAGTWKSAGRVLGGNFSIAWAVYDAEFFGVAQRRRRIFLVADLWAQCRRKYYLSAKRPAGVYCGEAQNVGRPCRRSWNPPCGRRRG